MGVLSLIIMNRVFFLARIMGVARREGIKQFLYTMVDYINCTRSYMRLRGRGFCYVGLYIHRVLMNSRGIFRRHGIL